MPLRLQKLLAIVVAVLALGATLTTIVLLRKNAANETLKNAEARLQAAEGPRIPIIDVHVHLGADGVEYLSELMKRYGFDHVVNLSGGTPGRGLEQQLTRAQSLPGKITTFVSLDYDQVVFPNYGARMTASLRAAHRMGAKGLKIAKVLGLGLPKPAPGLLMPVDDSELDPVFEAAGEFGMPIAIHAGDPRAFWQPVDERNERADELRAHPGWALYGQPVPSFDEILDQLERRIARHPKTTFISVHFGNCAEDPERVARMLRRYPNLFIDTAARIPEMGRHDPEKMRAFYEEFQDRILFGSDLGVGAKNEPLFLGSQGSTPPTNAEELLFFEATHRYFETADRDFAHPTPIQGKWKISGVELPRPILEKIYFRNAARVLNIAL
jgi:predicted TIM-barrel fold metal-dependent hydrolase